MPSNYTAIPNRIVPVSYLLLRHKAMKLYLLLCTALIFCASAQAQLSPAISSWLQNTTQTGTYYMKGNSTALSNGILVNCQSVEYSATNVYIKTHGIPSYTTGPFLDGNPSNATDQNSIYRFPLNPQKNSGAPTPTTLGNIGIFINGVALFDYRDGVSWNNAQNKLCGGPIQPPCQGDRVWNRDAIVAERGGFDCSKGHPAMGNYHHHQNPSAFKLDAQVISTVCNLYNADGLYVMNPAQHSPLLGFAYDGFPVYGAYAYKNTDGTGGIVRIKSGYQLRNISTRTTYADGSSVTAGPPVNSTYPLGYFREDYEYIAHPNDPDYLDEHNGRFCITPEYPKGTYAYFCTVDSNGNSAYPYAVGPTFYGVYANRKVTTIGEATTVYKPSTSSVTDENTTLEVSVFPNPSSELVAIQVNDIVKDDISVELYDVRGKLLAQTRISKGQTIAYFDIQTLYTGSYLLKLSGNGINTTRTLLISKE